MSLAETLLAVLILLLVTVIITTGAPVAKEAYEKVVLGANAQAMFSTAVSALRDELGTAWDIKVSDKSVTYFKAGTGAKGTISVSADNQPIQIQDYVVEDDDLILDGTSGVARHLVPDANTGLFVTYDTVSYSGGIVTIGGLRVCKQLETDIILAGGVSVNLAIRVLSAEPTVAAS